MKRIPVIKEYKLLNGRQVPIYKFVNLSDAEFKRVNEEASKRMLEANTSAADMTPEELIEAMKGHSKEVVTVGAGDPDLASRLAATMEQADGTLVIVDGKDLKK